MTENSTSVLPSPLSKSCVQCAVLFRFFLNPLLPLVDHNQRIEGHGAGDLHRLNFPENRVAGGGCVVIAWRARRKERELVCLLADRLTGLRVLARDGGLMVRIQLRALEVLKDDVRPRDDRIRNTRETRDLNPVAAVCGAFDEAAEEDNLFIPLSHRDVVVSNSVARAREVR